MATAKELHATVTKDYHLLVAKLDQIKQEGTEKGSQLLETSTALQQKELLLQEQGKVIERVTAEYQQYKQQTSRAI